MEDRKIILFPVPLEELKALISEAVTAAMAKEETGEELPPFMNFKEVAKFLGVSVSTVKNLRKQGIIKGQTVNSIVRFTREEVLNAFRSYERYSRKD